MCVGIYISVGKGLLDWDGLGQQGRIECGERRPVPVADWRRRGSSLGDFTYFTSPTPISPSPRRPYRQMMDIGVNLPHMTDEGAKAMGEGAKSIGEKATENLMKIVPSQTTTLVIAGGFFVLGFGWLALSFYKEFLKDDRTRHTVVHLNGTNNPLAQG